jgi:hypothetical protein
MKSFNLACLIFGLCFSTIVGQQTANKWDVEIPGPITDGTPSPPAPKPAPIDFKVLSSRTTRMDVTDWDHGTRDALKLGAMATVDGFIPWKDPFKNAGKYGECEDGAQFSQAMGGISREAALLATGAKIYQVIGSGVLKSSGIAGASALEQGAVGRAGVNALFGRQAFLEAYKGLGNTAYTVAQASKAFLASEYGLGVYDRISDVRDSINESFKDCD